MKLLLPEVGDKFIYLKEECAILGELKIAKIGSDLIDLFYCTSPADKFAERITTGFYKLVKKS